MFKNIYTTVRTDWKNISIESYYKLSEFYYIMIKRKAILLQLLLLYDKPLWLVKVIKFRNNCLETADYQWSRSGHVLGFVRTRFRMCDNFVHLSQYLNFGWGKTLQKLKPTLKVKALTHNRTSTTTLRTNLVIKDILFGTASIVKLGNLCEESHSHPTLTQMNTAAQGKTENFRLYSIFLMNKLGSRASTFQVVNS